MSYYDEDFYNEPSEFEQQIDEFKQSLMNAIKEKYKVDIERLRSENVELQKVKNDWKSIQSEYAAKAQQLENEKNNMERKLRGARLAELMKDVEVSLWDVGYEHVDKPKCANCNENRQYEFYSPTGKLMMEKCSCAAKETRHIPEEQMLCEFRNYNGKITSWYKKYRENNGDGFTLSSSTVMNTLYESGMDFNKINRYGTFFRNKDDCQKYCEWLNLPKAIVPTESA